MFGCWQLGGKGEKGFLREEYRNSELVMTKPFSAAFPVVSARQKKREKL